MLNLFTMKNSEQNRKEQLAIAIGFVLILCVFVFTLLRNDIFSDDNPVLTKSSSDEVQKNSSSQKYTTISTTDLQKKILIDKNKPTLLDVRPFDSYIEEHIMDSINIPLDEFPVGQKIDQRAQIVIIGQQTNDENIVKAVDKLKDEDFENILVLAGGIDTWKQLLGSTVNYGNPKSFVDQSKVFYLDPEELKKAIEAEASLYIIDVRSNADYNKGHIKGAINIPFDDLEKRRNEIKERKVIIVGLNEIQEFQASVQLFDMLLISPYVMRQAMPGWESKGFPLTQ
ncbi:MAG: hypothetical protein ACD_5C00331G0006 [uncultured bacterium]|nr:MAG: hypothetical protein ACD_5C00331G0006 [uncultured bacterium]